MTFILTLTAVWEEWICNTSCGFILFFWGGGDSFGAVCPVNGLILLFCYSIICYSVQIY